MTKRELEDIILEKAKDAIKGMEATKDDNGRWKTDYVSQADYWKNSGKAEAYNEIFRLLIDMDIIEEK